LEIQKLIDSEEILSQEKIESWVKRFRWHREKLRLFNIKFNKNSCSTKLLKKVLELFGHTLRFSHQEKKTGQRYYQVVKMTYRVDKHSQLDRWTDIYQAIEKKYLGLINKEITIENQEIKYSDNITARTIMNKEIELVTDSQNDINNYHGSVTHSKQDTVKDRDLLIEKVPKTELKSENNQRSQSSQKFITNIKIDYILAMSEIEFNLWSQKWLENGMSETELAHLITMRKTIID